MVHHHHHHRQRRVRPIQQQHRNTQTVRKQHKNNTYIRNKNGNSKLNQDFDYGDDEVNLKVIFTTLQKYVENKQNFGGRDSRLMVA